MSLRTSKCLMALGLAGLLGSGCGAGVHMMDRGTLARPEMKFEFRANDQVLDDHIYFSKEASSGSRGLGGGGCGCN